MNFNGIIYEKALKGCLQVLYNVISFQTSSILIILKNSVIIVSHHKNLEIMASIIVRVSLLSFPYCGKELT